MVHHKKIIFVSMNYRLGPLGFLTLENIDGNFAIKDQVAALKWVQRNIKNFGGDPSRVTIWGESAGAKSVDIHMTGLHGEGLFHRAISQSSIMGLHLKSRRESIHLGNMLTSLLDCPTNDIVCLRSKPADVIMWNRKSLPIQTSPLLIGDLLPWSPHVDGYYVRGQPRDLYKAGKYKKNVKILMGYNQDEFALFPTLLEEALHLLFPFFERGLPMYGPIYNRLLKYIFGDLSERLSNVYPSKFSDASHNMDRIIDIGTDFAFACPTLSVAEHLVNNGSEVYMYLYDYPAHTIPEFLVPRCSRQRACHGLELILTFHTLENLLKFDEQDHKISHAVIDLWAAFISGKESVEKTAHDKGNNIGEPFERPNLFHQAKGLKKLLYFGKDGNVRISSGDNRNGRCELWKDIGYSF
jgi:para-nitrobenzyl esterase